MCSSTPSAAPCPCQHESPPPSLPPAPRALQVRPAVFPVTLVSYAIQSMILSYSFTFQARRWACLGLLLTSRSQRGRLIRRPCMRAVCLLARLLKRSSAAALDT